MQMEKISIYTTKIANLWTINKSIKKKYLFSLLWLPSETTGQEFDDLLEQVSHHAHNDGGGIFWVLLIRVVLVRYVAGDHLLQDAQGWRYAQVPRFCTCKSV